MPRHITVAFPGQGSQFVGMLDHLPESFINNFKDDIRESLEFDILDIIKNGSEEKLNKTSITQPAILLTSYLEYKFMLDKLNIEPDLLCGHSLGEYTALVAAQAITLRDALRVVHKRGLYMEESLSGSMFAILNTDMKIIDDCCQKASFKSNKIVSPANINSSKQVVIAGEDEAVELAIEYLKNNGAKKCIRLNVSVPSHCELMYEAATKLSTILDKIKINNCEYELIHNLDAKKSNDFSSIKNKLILQLTKPVQWSDIMTHVKTKNGIFIECGPKNILSGLAKANDIDDIYTTSSSTFISEMGKIL
ncbi:MAG: [acyl-carrier-protein] S-malonyltransferase [SAR86 cluster bacterium]|uniref:Malonyl CoA-acyl carrier protein transacylase n=1 Tax=SAR86 cluster bacterium TaxID=2030880 RepID=A0A520N5L0_9GAMM|nr:MAG: [acyl-carrier-protein] S-malonyltransferase [SAR86 cluster bacterium]